MVQRSYGSSPRPKVGKGDDLMSVSLREVIEAAGYDLTSEGDCNWLLSKRNEMEELLDLAENTIYDIKEKMADEQEAEYRKQIDEEIEDRNEDTSDEYLTGEEDL